MKTKAKSKSTPKIKAKSQVKFSANSKFANAKSVAEVESTSLQSSACLEIKTREKDHARAEILKAGTNPASSNSEKSKSRVRVGEKEFILRLTEKLTHFDATMILEAAMLSAGVPRQEGHFKKDETKEICLALIKRGGPAFSVGTLIYREVVG